MGRSLHILYVVWHILQVGVVHLLHCMLSPFLILICPCSGMVCSGEPSSSYAIAKRSGCYVGCLTQSLPGRLLHHGPTDSGLDVTSNLVILYSTITVTRPLVVVGIIIDEVLAVTWGHTTEKHLHYILDYHIATIMY